MGHILFANEINYYCSVSTAVDDFNSLTINLSWISHLIVLVQISKHQSLDFSFPRVLEVATNYITACRCVVTSLFISRSALGSV